MTPKLTEKAVWAGSNFSSYEMAKEAVWQLAGQRLSGTRIRRLVQKAGEARLAERRESEERLERMHLPDRRRGKGHREAPEVAVVMMDGGRYQRRDHFAPRGERKARRTQEDAKTHWRETKVGSLLTMASDVHAEDPCPLIPDDFVHASVVREIAKMSENPDSNASSASSDAGELAGDSIGGEPSLGESDYDYETPSLISRDVVASSRSADQFGWQLEARAWELNFPSARRQAFVADGARTNWRIQQQHFPRATPIADLIHALSYAWSASKIAEGPITYQKWAQLIWQGDVAEVIEHLETLQANYGESPDPTPSDPRYHVDRALTYFRNNASHMDYPRYRQQGLPITSAHIESTVKLINRRVKGSEKFWDRQASEAVLQLRADYLSDSQPMASFWRRYHANQTGSNAYTPRSQPQSA